MEAFVEDFQNCVKRRDWKVEEERKRKRWSVTCFVRFKRERERDGLMKGLRIKCMERKYETQ